MRNGRGKKTADAIVLRSLARAAGAALDRAAIAGSASGEGPRGIRNMPGVPQVSIGPNGGAVTYGHIVHFEEHVGLADVECDTALR
jgi:hypothetical protein